MNMEKLEQVIELVRRHGLHQVEIEEAGTRISVTASAPQVSPLALPGVTAGFPGAVPMGSLSGVVAPASLGVGSPSISVATPPQGSAQAMAAPDAKKAPPTGKVVRSPFVGTLYRAPSPGADPFVEVGKRVKKGATLCIVEAMKLMNEIEAEFDGVIKEILVDNEQPVEFDQPLFVME
jgi:acetyl-CoA carboxylase biotin carboxyl carrier protein